MSLQFVANVAHSSSRSWCKEKFIRRSHNGTTRSAVTFPLPLIRPSPHRILRPDIYDRDTTIGFLCMCLVMRKNLSRTWPLKDAALVERETLVEAHFDFFDATALHDLFIEHYLVIFCTYTYGHPLDVYVHTVTWYTIPRYIFYIILLCLHFI